MEYRIYETKHDQPVTWFRREITFSRYLYLSEPKVIIWELSSDNGAGFRVDTVDNKEDFQRHLSGATLIKKGIFSPNVSKRIKNYITSYRKFEKNRHEMDIKATLLAKETGIELLLDGNIIPQTVLRLPIH